jgi:hypothetical protein
MESVNQMSDYVNKGLDFVNKNKILSSVLGMLLVLYAAAAAPKLPKSVVKIFDNSLFKLGYMFMIAYLATKDPSVAIITAVALLVTIQTLASREASESAVKAASAESQKQAQVRTESELMKVAQERVATRQEAPVSEIKIVSEGPKMVAVKESFAENEEIRIPLSPSRAQFIEECTRRADAHYGAAAKAEAEGKPALAEAHKQEAAKQEIKIDAIVAAKQHMVAAEEAQSSGNVELAQAHMQEAAKQETKADALVKSEAHAVAAEEAKSAGNIELAKAHMEESVKQEAKAEALVKSEAHAVAAEEALKRGAVAEAEAHKKMAVVEESKALSMVRAESEKVVVETEIKGLPVPHSEVEHAPAFVSSESVVIQAKQATCGAPFDVEGYTGGVYAEI